VQNRTLLVTDWWASGIVHTKLWMANKEDAYLGSANNDWKSLTQVKEVGVYLKSCPHVVKLLEGYFNNFWTLTDLNATEHTSVVWDQQWQLSRRVPCWSHYVEPHDRCQ
jgi:phospholipase D3/4